MVGAIAVQAADAAGRQRGTNVGWHQDYNYWSAWEEGSELFTAWVALSDVTAASGPMQFVVGSHEWGLSTESDFYSQEYEAKREAIQRTHGREWVEMPAILPPGGASFHQKLTFHGSGPNVSSQPRRAFAVHLRTENSRPKDDAREGLTSFIDDPGYCPVIFGDASSVMPLGDALAAAVEVAIVGCGSISHATCFATSSNLLARYNSPSNRVTHSSSSSGASRNVAIIAICTTRAATACGIGALLCAIGLCAYQTACGW